VVTPKSIFLNSKRAVTNILLPIVFVGLAGCSTSSVVQSDDPVGSTDRLVEIETEIGNIQVKFYSDKAPVAVTELIKLVKSGNFDSDTFLEARPQLGFAIAKIGDTAKAFDFKDDTNNLTSGRGSVGISKLSASNAYLNNIFFGYNSQPDLEKHYTIIGQVIKGLDLIERSAKGSRYKVNSFKLTNMDK